MLITVTAVKYRNNKVYFNVPCNKLIWVEVLYFNELWFISFFFFYGCFVYLIEEIFLHSQIKGLSKCRSISKFCVLLHWPLCQPDSTTRFIATLKIRWCEVTNFILLSGWFGLLSFFALSYRFFLGWCILFAHIRGFIMTLWQITCIHCNLTIFSTPLLPLYPLFSFPSTSLIACPSKNG